MTDRRIVGGFDPSTQLDRSRLDRALDPASFQRLTVGPLSLAYTGPAVPATNPICLLDGWLDNADAIAQELGGAAPASHEELLAAGFRRWGRGLPGRLRGDFALIIWDREREEGLIARDQLGVRPFFFRQHSGSLLFAAEIRDLLAIMPQRPGPDPAGVAHWVALSTRPGTGTLYAGVNRLAPGGALVLERGGVRSEVYWAPRYREPLRLSSAELAAQVRASLEQSMRRRIAPDAKSGVLMSGGLDSSSIAALGAEGGILACSATFPEHPIADEAELIGELRRSLGLSGVNVEVRPGGLLASAIEYLDAWQMPLLGWGDFWTLPLMRAAAAEGVEVMLDGDGGDELFGPHAYLLADRLRAGHPLQTLALARELPGGRGEVARREVAEVLGSFALGGALPYRIHGLARHGRARRQLPRWLSRASALELLGSDEPHAWKRLDGPRWWAHSAYGLARGIEANGVFEHQRRRAAMAGVEARHPLLDLDLIELSLRQAPGESFDPRFSRPLLRAAMAGLLPDPARLRPEKARFESLVIDCLTGPDRDAVRAILSAP